MGGLLGSLPFLAAQGHSTASTLLSAAQIFASCLLFGVTFRYVQSPNPGNTQLKLGALAAFGLVSISGSLCRQNQGDIKSAKQLLRTAVLSEKQYFVELLEERLAWSEGLEMITAAAVKAEIPIAGNQC